MNHTPTQRPRTPVVRRRPSRPARRGVAMLLVLGVIVVASVLGYAMLSNAAMQKQANTSVGAIAGAQAMAESGVNLAIYYLQNPGNAPTYPTSYPATEEYDRQRQYWTGTGDQFVDFGTPSAGSVKVAVSRVNEANRWQYRIESFGRAPESTLTRKVEATVNVNAEYRVDHAAMLSKDATLPGNAIIGHLAQGDGDIYSNAGVAARTGGRVYGTLYRRKPLTSQVVLAWQNAPLVPKVVPRFDEVRSYMTYEYPTGTVNQATVLTNVTHIGSGHAITRLDPAPGNPAGIYYAPGDLTLVGGAVVNGTLIVQGNLTMIPAVLGGEIQLRRAQPGFPALVVGNNLNFNALLSVAPTARVEGLTYVANRIDASGLLLPTFQVNGALLVGGVSPVFLSLPLSYLRVYYDRELAHVPDFTEVGRTPMSIKVNDWDAQGQ